MAAAAVCLVAAGLVRATLPSSEFTVTWMHSIEKTRWEERYVVAGSSLSLVEARVQALGAGMEPPDGAELRDGWWRWRPRTTPLTDLRLTYSTFTQDYTICAAQRCASLRELVGVPLDQGDVVSLKAC
ncbi:MAG: DUF1850 domain-containing protein [Betaproteobacteria bacterium]